jgi:histidine kinase
MPGQRQHDDPAIDPVIDSLAQPLCAISLNADAIARLLGRDPPDLDEVRAALADIVNDVRRAEQALRDAQAAAATPAGSGHEVRGNPRRK